MSEQSLLKFSNKCFIFIPWRDGFSNWKGENNRELRSVLAEMGHSNSQLKNNSD